MKNDSRGFMLAEVVVVSVIISTVLVTLFTGLNRMSTAYETRNKYYDIDAAYIAQGINDIVIKNDYISDLASDGTPILLTYKYSEISEYVNTIIDEYDPNQKVNAYLIFANMDFYGIDITDLPDLLSNRNPNSSDNETFIEYLNYISQNIIPENYTYFIIVELQKDVDDCYYYTLKVR